MNGSKKHLIYLTGFMGSGKTTIAPILANTLGYECMDIDRTIERMTGKKVSEIFSDFGEKYFRDLEHTVLTEFSGKDGYVISLGGGTITNSLNLKIVKSSGILVYLKANSEQIFQRMKYKTDRPMLTSGDGSRLDERELNTRITALLAKREPFYNQADITISTDEIRVGITVDKIVHSIHQFER